MRLFFLKIFLIIFPFLRRLFLARAIRLSGLEKTKTEEKSELKLTKKLQFAGYKVQRQVVKKTKSGIQRADLLICRIPIELKYRPSGPELDRVTGQMLRYKKEWGNGWCVIVNGKKEDAKRVRRYAKCKVILCGEIKK